MPRRFDHYVIVDWSAANQPKIGRDSIWICHRGPHGETCENPKTRDAARAALGAIIEQPGARGERVLLGFDFPFGYPAGFAHRLGLQGAPWRAVWDEIAGLIEDSPDNRNNRFQVGEELNRRVSGQRFPFWGCPPSHSYAHLGPKHHNGHAADGLAERRLIDRWMVGAQPCWKLAYTGSVGSQALTGIPVVRALRDDRRWADRARIWPFETGLCLPNEAQIVFAEVWPSWWRKMIRPEFGPPNDRAQVRSVAAIFAEEDRAGRLAGWFAGDLVLSAEQRRIVETEEAWTLGVTARRHSAFLRPINDPLAGPDPAIPVFPSAPLKDVDARTKSGQAESAQRRYSYLRDPAAIYRRSFAQVRQEADIARFPVSLRPLAVRLAHAAGDVSILADLVWSRGAVAAGRRALAGGAPILVDSEMTVAGLGVGRLAAANRVICTLRDPDVPALAATSRTTRSAAAVELWRPHLDGAVVAIGNAPTALFRLLELIEAGAAQPAVVLGFPVGFVGAAEAKEALIGFGRSVPYIALRGRRGGSALAAAAVNALARKRAA